MGRLEKIVVLTVLFLVALILAVSLNTNGGAADPSEDVQAGVDEEPRAGTDTLRPTLAEPVEVPQGPAGLLNAPIQGERPQPELSRPQSPPSGSDKGSILPVGEPERAPVRSEPSPAAAAPVAQTPPPDEAPRPYLLTTEGLVASRVPDLMIYTWAEGDTFTSLSDRYFGSRLETGRLRSVNEGRDESNLRPGEKIFVPSRPAEAVQQLQRTSRVAGQWLGAGVYVVQSGDMLGSIAKDVYGSAASWRKIYDANRDVLAGPDQLKVGMKLRIPAE